MNDTTFRRDANGIPHVEATSPSELFRRQGYAHGYDRGMQMLLMRLVGQGRISEVLEASDDSLRLDTFFRRVNWSGAARAEIHGLAASERALLDAYCTGVNAALVRRVPWELRICGYRLEPWRGEDTLLLVRMIGYLTLAQSQAECERLLVEMVQAGVPENKLQELFPGILGGLDIPLLRQVKLGERLVPAALWNLALPRLTASNNWAIAGWRSASGKPILANDTHLEANRLPAVWCEMSLTCQSRYLAGGSIPGVPGILSGKNNDLAWGPTYAYADGEDSWIERCRDGQFYRQENDCWMPFRRRTEHILRKGRPPVEVAFFENDHGVLDGDPRAEGYYLATRWAAAEKGTAAIRAAFALLNARNVDDAMEFLGRIETGWNWVLADKAGHIGYQMSGLVPQRRPEVSGFVPLPGWQRENDWLGFLEPEDLPRSKDPPEGYLATANENLNALGRAHPINMAMGPYRADRIRELLAQRQDWRTEDFMKIQTDLHSRQAAAFMAVLKPLLPKAPAASVLRDWDLSYAAESEGAYLFERFYEHLQDEVFGKSGIGERAVAMLRQNSGLFVDFYHNFDQVLLAEQSAWFGGRQRDEVFRHALDRTLQEPVRKLAVLRQLNMNHLILGGKLPRWLGFDQGPYAMSGGRATIQQAQFYRSAGRETSFLPAFRMIADLQTGAVMTNMPGGPSDRRFSRWYCSDVENWLGGRYKCIEPIAGPDGQKASETHGA